jgi:GAF domain-containing protein
MINAAKAESSILDTVLNRILTPDFIQNLLDLAETYGAQVAGARLQAREAELAVYQAEIRELQSIKSRRPGRNLPRGIIAGGRFFAVKNGRFFDVIF